MLFSLNWTETYIFKVHKLSKLRNNVLMQLQLMWVMQTCGLLFCAHLCSVVCPMQSIELMFAPNFSSNSTTSMWFLSTATCKGVSKSLFFQFKFEESLRNKNSVICKIHFSRYVVQDHKAYNLENLKKSIYSFCNFILKYIKKFVNFKLFYKNL